MPFSDRTTVLLSVRPEALELRASVGHSVDANAINGRVVASAYQGSIVEYEIAVGNRSIKAHMVNPKGKPMFQSGEAVAVVFSPDDVVIVNAT
jgi:ABC-type Fe3+/spermidine/putrescine transport system ATPase subunit